MQGGFFLASHSHKLIKDMQKCRSECERKRKKCECKKYEFFFFFPSRRYPAVKRATEEVGRQGEIVESGKVGGTCMKYSNVHTLLPLVNV